MGFGGVLRGLQTLAMTHSAAAVLRLPLDWFRQVLSTQRSKGF